MIFLPIFSLLFKIRNVCPFRIFISWRQHLFLSIIFWVQLRDHNDIFSFNFLLHRPSCVLSRWTWNQTRRLFSSKHLLLGRIRTRENLLDVSDSLMLMRFRASNPSWHSIFRFVFVQTRTAEKICKRGMPVARVWLVVLFVDPGYS